MEHLKNTLKFNKPIRVHKRKGRGERVSFGFKPCWLVEEITSIRLANQKSAIIKVHLTLHFNFRKLLDKDLIIIQLGPISIRDIYDMLQKLVRV